MGQFEHVWRSLPPVTKNLIIVNFIVWIAMAVSPKIDIILMNIGALHYFEAPDFNPAQLLTYMFLHGSFSHVLFNMFTLFFFGIALERVMGSPRFLFYYITCGLGAALIQEGVWALTLPDMIVSELARMNYTTAESMRSFLASNPDVLARNLDVFTTVGASGAIYGVLLAFAMLFPNQPMYLMFIPIPVKAKWMVAGFVVIEVLMGLGQATDGVAHFAHLGGMVIGFFIILYWKKKGNLNGRYY